MNDFLQRLKQRKIVQWAIAYVAFWFALLQGIDIVATRFNWPDSIERYFILALAIGFCVVLVLAWYHGERGAQRIGGTELVIIALLLAIGGVLIWRFGPAVVTAKGALAAHSAPAGAIAASAPAASVAKPPAAAIAAQPIPAKSIAVLPFENLSNDKNNAYFVAGMQDLILTKLADIGDLKVIARTSTQAYGSHPQNLKTVGEQLGVATILEGSVQKQGNEVLINVQLIDAKTDSHIWAKAYTRTLTNVFGVEGEVATQIAASLNAKLSPVETARLASDMSSNNRANDLFLQAEYQANQGVTNMDTASFKSAIPLYRQAIAQAPTFALAYARLSFVQSNLAWFGGGGADAKQLVVDARSNAEQALKLAPNLPAAHLALGYSDYYGRSDYAAASHAFTAALALRPNDADALAAQGYVERFQGRFAAALATLQRAFALDPRTSVRAEELGSTCMMMSRYRDAERWLRRALALDPHNVRARLLLPLAITFATGDIPRALAEAQGDDATMKLMRADLLTAQRKYQEALTLRDSVPKESGDSAGGDAMDRAELYRLMGDMARARPLYAQALPKLRAQVKNQQDSYDQASAWDSLATAELGLGHLTQGLAAITKAQAIGDKGHGLYEGSLKESNAALYAEAHRPDLAVPLLAQALASPGIGRWYSPVMLWLDPDWDPIRKDPRFQALLQKYAKYKPAVTYDNPPASPSSTPSPPQPSP